MEKTFSCPPFAAEHGSDLLWSQWLEKHPETETRDPEGLTVLLADPHTRLQWEQHLAETYYSYWEQYTYWAAQGWTVERGSRADNPGDLDHQFGHSCSLGDAVVPVVEEPTPSHHGFGTRDCGSAEEPQDGGGEGKREAGSSKNNSAEHTGRSSCPKKDLPCVHRWWMKVPLASLGNERKDMIRAQRSECPA